MTSPHLAGLNKLLELDATIHRSVMQEALTLVSEALHDGPQVQRVLDIGSGPGIGSCALAHHFPGAEVVAVDVNNHMLMRAQENAQAAGIDLNVMLADISAHDINLASAEMIWSSAALHEVSDPRIALRHLFTALTPGGIMAIMEMDTPTRVLPDQLGEFEDRLHYAVGYTPAVDHPEWTSFLQAAGFELVERRQLTLDQQLPGAGIAGSYAALELRRVGHRGIDTLSEEDQATYHRLVAHGAGAVEDLGILRIRSSRTLWLARRPL